MEIEPNPVLKEEDDIVAFFLSHDLFSGRMDVHVTLSLGYGEFVQHHLVYDTRKLDDSTSISKCLVVLLNEITALEI